MRFTGIFLFFAFVFSFAGRSAESFPLNHSSEADTLLTDNDTIIISQLIITGNQVTRMSIIQRELVIHELDTLPRIVFERAIERTKENLMNTNLFNFVTIQHQKLSKTEYAVIIDLKERWYVFPVPIFELVDRNFNEFVKSGDWSRINYGAYLNWDNFRGMNESLRLLFRWGYSQRIGVSYAIPFINKNQEEGLIVGASYSRNREAGYKVDESKLILFKDENDFVRKEIAAGIRYTHRNGFYDTGSFAAEYRYNSISDTIAQLNPEFLGQGRTRQELITLSWQFRRDHRDFKIYPLKGYLFDVDVVKQGIGVLANEPDLLYLAAQVKYFKQLAPRWYTTHTVKGKLSGQSDASFFNTRGFGYGNELVRGYEFYVIPGQNYLLSRNSFKFALLPTRVLALPFNFLEKFRTIPYAFYLNANFDLGYVRDRQTRGLNPLANTLQLGYGVGLDYVTYYNLVFRMEYSFNKFGENGFFLHFTAPI
ncbi:MAG: hypothetical protein JNL49_08775 [Bacteroidia bacterium]|nr:hypothetical protein [Bacteroidia bacterium]